MDDPNILTEKEMLQIQAQSKYPACLTLWGNELALWVG